VDFMLSKSFQEDMPLQMFVFPVNPEARLDEAFVKHLAIPQSTASVARTPSPPTAKNGCRPGRSCIALKFSFRAFYSQVRQSRPQLADLLVWLPALMFLGLFYFYRSAASCRSVLRAERAA